MMRRVIVMLLPAATLLVPTAPSAYGQNLENSAIVASVEQEQQQAKPTAPRRRRPVTRKTATAEIAGKKLELSYGLPKIDGREFAEVDQLEPGAVVRLFASPALRFRTEVALLFGDRRVATDNAAPVPWVVFGLDPPVEQWLGVVLQRSGRRLGYAVRQLR